MIRHLAASRADPELAQLLAALCSDDKARRGPAEAALAGSRQLPGFAARLAAFGTNGGGIPPAPVELPLRQQALTCLRRLIGDHWPTLATEDTAAVRQAMLGSVAEECSALRGLVHGCLVQIRARGGPWPELSERLGVGLASGNAAEAAACVDCITALLDEAGVEVAAGLGPLQRPLLQLASSPAAPPALRRKCVDAHLAGATTVVASSAVVGAAAVEAVVAALPAWLEVHAALCTGPDSWTDRERVACAMAAVRASTSLSRLPPLRPTLAGTLEGVLRPACLLVRGLEGAYTEAVIRTDDGGASEEEDGGPAQLVAQLMELVQAMLPPAPLRALLKGHVTSLLQLLVPFMRVTEAQARTWREDPNEFLAQEEDGHTRGAAIRVSGEYMVSELLAHMKREASRAVAALVKELLERGEAGRGSGDPQAWKLTELALLLFANAAFESTVKALQRGDFAPLLGPALSTAARLSGDASAPDLLRARAFVTLRKLGDAVCALLPGELPALLEAAAAGLEPSRPLVVRIGACRAFCRFLTAARAPELCSKLLLERGVLSSLASLMRGSDEELLHMTLESLCVIVRTCPDAIVSVEASFSQLILEIWRRSLSDPLVILQVLDLTSCAAAGDARLQASMEDGLMPAILQDLQPGVEPYVASSAVQLYGVLVKRSAVPLKPVVWQCVEPLLGLAMRSDESGLLENSCDALICLVRRSPSQITDSGLLLPILRCVERLLGPGLDDDACFFVGPFTMLLLSTFGKLLPPEVTVGLLRALVTRLARAERPYLQQELLVVVARLMHEDLPGVVSALQSMRLPDPGGGGGERTGLEVLLVAWFANAQHIRARRARNVTISALCRLHERCAEDQALRDLRLGGAGSRGLPESILEVVLAGLEFENERCRKQREGARGGGGEEDDGDEEDDEDDEEDGIGADDELKSKRAQKLYSDLIDLEDDEDDEDELADMLAPGGGGAGEGDVYHELEKADPLYSLDVRKLAADYLARQQQAPPPALPAPPAPLLGRIAAAVAEARSTS